MIKEFINAIEYLETDKYLEDTRKHDMQHMCTRPMFQSLPDDDSGYYHSQGECVCLIMPLSMCSLDWTSQAEELWMKTGTFRTEDVIEIRNNNIAWYNKLGAQNTLIV